DIRDPVANECIAHELRPQSTQMHHTCAAYKWPNESDHEINGVVCGKNAQVTHSRPERIPRRQRFALLEIIFVGQHAAFWPAPRAGGIHDASGILSFTGDQTRIAFAAEFFPTIAAA